MQPRGEAIHRYLIKLMKRAKYMSVMQGNVDHAVYSIFRRNPMLFVEIHQMFAVRMEQITHSYTRTNMEYGSIKPDLTDISKVISVNEFLAGFFVIFPVKLLEETGKEKKPKQTNKQTNEQANKRANEKKKQKQNRTKQKTKHGRVFIEPHGTIQKRGLLCETLDLLEKRWRSWLIYANRYIDSANWKVVTAHDYNKDMKWLYIVEEVWVGFFFILKWFLGWHHPYSWECWFDWCRVEQAAAASFDAYFYDCDRSVRKRPARFQATLTFASARGPRAACEPASAQHKPLRSVKYIQ